MYNFIEQFSKNLLKINVKKKLKFFTTLKRAHYQ